MTSDLLMKWFAEYFKSLIKGYYSEKKIPFQLLLIENALGHSRALMKMHKETHAVFLHADTKFLLQTMDQGIILSFKLYLRSIFHRARAAIDGDSSY